MPHTVFVASVLLTVLFASSRTMPASVEIRPEEETVEPPALKFSAELENYPITESFLKSVDELTARYELLKKYHLLHISANFTDTLEGENEEEACGMVNQHILNNLQPKREPVDTCSPTYSCDYDEARFPATLIKVTCPVMKCIDENLYRGACSSINSELTYLRFKKESEGEPEVIAGSGGQEEPPMVRIGKWYHHTVRLATDCYCSDAK